jgi:pimeloyl-ACP methyl ester carboxylesterase
MTAIKFTTLSVLNFMVLVCLLVSLAGCEQAMDARKLAMQTLQARNLVLAETFQDCERSSTTSAPALVARSRCLLFTTPENPAAPQGRQLQLQVMVIPSVRQFPEPDPFVILVGGPGQAATVDALPVIPFFQSILQDRDILLVDQRGTGKLSPFDCEFGDEEEETTGIALLLQLQTQYLQDCLATIDAEPEYYTTDIAVQDLDAIRSYLGYSQLNLWGISYGTRVALAYLNYFPDATRTVVIDGVAPVGVLPLEAARDSALALQNVFALCTNEAACATAFPALQTHYDELVAKYALPVTINVLDQTTGQEESIELQAAKIQSSLFTLLYSRETTRLIPLFIEQLYQQNFQMLTAITGVETGVNPGMYYSVLCSEDMPLLDANELAAAAGASGMPFYDTLVLPRVEACKVWPSRTLAQEFFAPVISDKPVLIFSASQDPVTPQRWGEQVAATLSNSRHLIAKGIGHGVFGYGCATKLIAELVDSAEVQNLDATCLDQLTTRPFFLSPGGSAVTDD